MYLLDEVPEVAGKLGMERGWTLTHIYINVILLALVIYTFLFKIAFRIFDYGKRNTSPGYTDQKLEDEIF